MKKDNLIKNPRFILKSMLVACFLLLIQATNSKAQTPYAQLTFNIDYSSSYAGNYYYTTRIDFYADEACTIPVADPNVSLNFMYVSRIDCGTRDEQSFTGTSAELAGNYYGAPCHLEWGSFYDSMNNWYELKPGTGYLVGTPNYIGGPADYCP